MGAIVPPQRIQVSRSIFFPLFAKNALCPRSDRGRGSRGTTSGSPPPHGGRPRRVPSHSQRGNGRTRPSLLDLSVQGAAPGCIHGVRSPLFTNPEALFAAVGPLLLPIITVIEMYYSAVLPVCQMEISARGGPVSAPVLPVCTPPRRRAAPPLRPGWPG